MNNKIFCPTCLRDGIDKVIGEILGEGTISIEHTRKKFGNPEATIVRGSNYELICGYCNNIVYIRKEVKDEPQKNVINFTNMQVRNYFSGTIITV